MSRLGVMRGSIVGAASGPAAVFAVALTVRVVHVWQMRDTLFFSLLMGDARGYDTWARQIAAGDWLGREVFYQAPLYPYVLGTVYTVFGHDLLAARLVHAVCGAAGAAALAVAAARLFSARAGLIAGLMLALYPPAIFLDGLIQKSVLDILLVCVALALAATIVRDGDTRRRWLALGATVGALALTRENAIALAVVLLIWAYRRQRGQAAVFALGIALMLTPVVARNYAVSGGLYLTTSQFGSNLYIGNNPAADGSYTALRAGRGSPEYERADAAELAQQAVGRPLTPAEVSGYWAARARDYIRSQPLDWLRLLARKGWLLVNTTEVIDTESQESHAEFSWPLRVLGRVWNFAMLLALSLVGMVVTWPRRRELAAFYALPVAYAGSVIAFYVVARYRLPLAPLLMPFAAAAVLGYRQVRLPAVALAAGAFALSSWPLYPPDKQKAITENNLGAALQEAGRLDDAVGHYRRALTLSPGYTPAMNNLGTALRAKGQSEEAVATYDAAIATRGSVSASLHLNRGNALMQQGRLADAVASFRQALAVEPQSAEARRALTQALYDTGTEALASGAFAQAETALREALALRRDYAEAHNNLGIALASQGRLDEAIRAWEAALAIDPTLTDARRNLQLARQN